MNRVHKGLLGIPLFLTLLLLPTCSQGQTGITTIPVAKNPTAVAVNAVTSKIYVASCPDRSSRSSGINGSVTVIDGHTNATASVEVGMCPVAIAVNEKTNKIYVADFGHTSLYCGSCFNYGDVTVIDGETNSTTTLVDGNAKFPQAVALNLATNKIYVTNNFSDNITVIDGTSNAITSLPAVVFPYDVAVNPTNGKIYVTSFNPDAVATQTSIAVIDGITGDSTIVTDPNAADPIAVAVNPVTNKIYVANIGNEGKNGTNAGSVTILDGVTNSTTNIVDANAFSPHAMAVNSISGKIYVANANNVTVIDGTTNSLITISDPNAKTSCGVFGTANVAVDAANNKIYVVNCSSNNVTVLDGATNSVTTVSDPNAIGPIAVAVNSITGRTYVANSGSNNVTVIDSGSAISKVNLSVELAGDGNGTVTSTPGGIACGSACTESFSVGETVTLTALPVTGSSFSSWSGACTGTTVCSITLDGAVSVVATFSLQDFSLTPASTSLVVARGVTATDIMTVTGLNGGFGSPIELSCTVAGPAPMPACGLSQASVTPGVNSATSTLTITAPMTTAALPSVKTNRLPYAVIAPLFLGFVSAGSSRRRRRGIYMLLGCTTVAFFVLGACGGGSDGSKIQTPTNYTITVTATSGAIAHTAQITASVQ
jgi:YVTN family beta-propeller protein